MKKQINIDITNENAFNASDEVDVRRGILFPNPKNPAEANQNIDQIEKIDPGSVYVFRKKSYTAEELKKEIERVWIKK